MAAGLIILAIELVENGEKLKGYWDETGLDMHIAVKSDGRLAVSTKHWGRVHYICTDKTPDELWVIVRQIAEEIGRSLIKSQQGPYVYIPKLNVNQTQSVFNKFKDQLGYDNVERILEWSWNISDAVVLLKKKDRVGPVNDLI
jgi:hypothetical protein